MIQAILVQSSAKLTKRLYLVLAIMIILWMAVSPTMMSAYAGLGGYISEKIMGGAGGADSSLYLGDASGVMVLGSAPLISTLSATNLQDTSTGGVATLNGSLSLNGMPNANVWFEWGYASGALTHTTPTVNVISSGVKSATISGFSNSETVYYRMASSSDSTSYGNIVDFKTGRGLSFYLLLNLVTLVIAAGILIVALNVGLTGNWVAALILIIIGLIGIVIVRGLLGG